MKNFVFALAALSLSAGGAMAASSGVFNAPARPAETIEVPAGSVMTTRELSQAGLKATDLVSVTRVSKDVDYASIDTSSRGEY